MFKSASRFSKAGFTLIELMVVVAIIAILAAIAYPSYLDSVRKSRRADGLAALTAAQVAQEKYRANHTTYGTLDQIGTGGTSPDSYYAMTVSGIISDFATCAISGSPSSTNFAIKASGQNGQDQDTGCTALCVDETGTFYPTACIRK